MGQPKLLQLKLLILGLLICQTPLARLEERTARSKTFEKHVIIKVKQPPLTIPTTTVSTTMGSSTTPVTVPTTVRPSTVPKLTPNSTVATGIGCGTKRMKPFEVVRIESLDFGRADYPNNEACTWKFIGKECTVTTECPCFDVPPSFDCIEDYLKFLDLPHYHQKFCGPTVPNGIYRTSSDFFTVRFRANKRESGKGFVCFVQCTPPGYADQVTPNMTSVCPTFRNYYNTE